jgi:hypothetical protein
MEKLIDRLEELATNMVADIVQVRKGNKAAAKRIRKMTLEIGNGVGKEFRKVSVKETM